MGNYFKSNFIIFILPLLCIAQNAMSFDGYFYDHAIGWHWYQDPKDNKEENEEESQNPVEQMSGIRKKVQEQLDKAILKPSQENIKDYLVLQNQVMQNASRFEHVWQAMLLQHPELDYSLVHPTNNIAKQVEYDQTKLKEENVIHELAKKSGLFFFYRSNCPYCRRFAPIVKDFAENYGITVIPITTDGVPLPEFPESKKDSGQAAKFHVAAEPALFAVDPYKGSAFPISFGLTSEEDIKKRIMHIATHFDGNVS